MPRQWTAGDILNMAKSYQAACVLSAAADLEVFNVLAKVTLSAAEVASRLRADCRGMAALLDALVALELLEKQDDCYRLARDTAAFLTSSHPRTLLSMVQHHGNCLRRWSQLARVVRDGKPAVREPSVRGEDADQAAFIVAMHNISVSVADELVRALPPLNFRRLLDVGGASGTWTLAFLRAYPEATATLFDLEHVLPLAQQRIAEAGMSGRVTLAGGDFLADALPAGADLAWVSAIVHQNSRAQNRQLFRAVAQALVGGSWILIRDVLMEESRTAPVAGALFAINMLVATEAGGTYTFAELREDLETAGFVEAEVVKRDEAMNSVIRARKR